MTGIKFTTGEPFDLNRVSNLDVAPAGDRLLERAKELGVELRGGGGRTAPLSREEMKALGLLPLQRQLSTMMDTMMERKATFMIYGCLQTAVERDPLIVWPKL